MTATVPISSVTLSALITVYDPVEWDHKHHTDYEFVWGTLRWHKLMRCVQFTEDIGQAEVDRFMVNLRALFSYHGHEYLTNHRKTISEIWQDDTEAQNHAHRH